MFAVPAPTNVYWDGTILKWDLPELTNDSIYKGVQIELYSKAGDQLSGIGVGVRYEYDFSSTIYHGRTYYATINTRADVKDGNKEVYSPTITSPEYTDPNPKDTLEVPDVTLIVNGTVSWGDIGYTFVRATLQKLNGSEWNDITSEKTSNGWNQSVSLGAITTPGTYRAIAEGLQGDDVVRRGISENLVVEEMFTVSFNAQTLFTNPDDISVAKNSTISAPELSDSYKNKTDGHVFYWSTDVAGNMPWVFSEGKITQDTTLYAQWIELPELNPVWDVDTCKWTLAENMKKVFANLSVRIFTENGNNVISTGTSNIKEKWYGDYYFPGRKYKFTVSLTDFHDNYVSAESTLRTFPGEVAVMELENMTVTKASSTAKVEWGAPKNGTYVRHGELYQWNKSTSDWDKLKTHVDISPNWNNTFLVFDQELDDAEYYKIHCTLNQGEYVIYEGEIHYGTTPATAIGNTDASDNAGAVKLLRDGQLIIIRDGKTFNALGAEVK